MELTSVDTVKAAGFEFIKTIDFLSLYKSSNINEQ